MNYKKNKVLLAVMVNDMEGLMRAIHAEKDVNMKGPKNMTALHMAAILGNEQAARLLLEAGAKIEAKDGNDMTPLAYAVLPATEIPAPQLKEALKTEQGVADLNEAKKRVRQALVEHGANWHVKSANLTPFQRFEAFWPEKVKDIVPQVGPAKI